MHILVLQHETVEHPGIFRKFLNEDGHTYDAVELQLGEQLPDLASLSARYDALWVMGGPMDVWEEDTHPWLADEKAFIKAAIIDHKLPFLGLCLGHQLLAEALGGTVGPSKIPEVGIMDVEIIDNLDAELAFKGLPQCLETLQWHGAEVKTVPDGAICLAQSPVCKFQALSFGPCAISAQFHMEIEEDTVENWANIPAYAGALEIALGVGALDCLEKEVAAKLMTFNSQAQIFYNNWMALATNT